MYKFPVANGPLDFKVQKAMLALLAQKAGMAVRPRELHPWELRLASPQSRNEGLRPPAGQCPPDSRSWPDHTPLWSDPQKGRAAWSEPEGVRFPVTWDATGV